MAEELRQFICSRRAPATEYSKTSYSYYLFQGGHALKRTTDHRRSPAGFGQDVYIAWFQQHFWRLAFLLLTASLYINSYAHFRKMITTKTTNSYNLIYGKDNWIYAPAALNLASGFALGGFWVHWWFFRLHPLLRHLDVSGALVQDPNWPFTALLVFFCLATVCGLMACMKLVLQRPDCSRASTRCTPLGSSDAEPESLAYELMGLEMKQDLAVRQSDLEGNTSLVTEIEMTAFQGQMVPLVIFHLLWIVLLLTPSLVSYPEWPAEISRHEGLYGIIVFVWFTIGVISTVAGLFRLEGLLDKMRSLDSTHWNSCYWESGD